MAKWLAFAAGLAGVALLALRDGAWPLQCVMGVGVIVLSLAVLVLWDRLMEGVPGSRKTLASRERRFRELMKRAHCLAFDLEAEAALESASDGGVVGGRVVGGGLHVKWDVSTALDREVAQNLLPLDLPEGGAYRFEDFAGRRHPEDAKRCDDTFEDAVVRKLPMYSQQYRCLNRHGQYQWFAETVHLDQVSEGRWRITGIIQDITEQRRVEESLRVIMRRAGCIIFHGTLRTGEDAGDAAQHGWDMQVADDEAAQRVLPLEVGADETYMGCWIRSRLEEDYKQTSALLCQALAGNTARYTCVFRCRDREGRVHWISQDVHLEPIAPRTYHVVNVAVDVTVQKQIEESLHEARRAADAANAAKTQFLANMSHEIRTPMTAILGYAELLADAELPADDRASYVRTIRRNGEHLMNVINDILDLSRIESGKLAVVHVACSPAELAHEVAKLMRPSAANKGIRLEVKVDGAVPGKIVTDPTRLRQIMVNLVGNAVKFTEKGSVELHLRYEAAGKDEPVLVVEVRDTGIGIPAERLPMLFSPFQQVDESASRRFGGTGLGLAISRRLAQMLGGDIVVQSEVGTGSTFTATIAAPSITTIVNGRHAPSDISAPADLHGVRVLLAEDSPDSRKLVCIHLRRLGCQVRAVENGRQAVELAAATEGGGEAFDVVLMDMQMPVLDGYEAAWQMRSEGYRKPIIALTAHAMEGDRERCIAAGCTDYSVKPINIPQLSRMIRDYADRSAAAL